MPFTDVRRMRVTVFDQAGHTVLTRRGQRTLNAVKVIRAGTYRVRVTGPAKGRYRVTVVRSAR